MRSTKISKKKCTKKCGKMCSTPKNRKNGQKCGKTQKKCGAHLPPPLCWCWPSYSPGRGATLGSNGGGREGGGNPLHCMAHPLFPHQGKWYSAQSIGGKFCGPGKKKPNFNNDFQNVTFPLNHNIFVGSFETQIWQSTIKKKHLKEGQWRGGTKIDDTQYISLPQSVEKKLPF